MRAMEPKDMQKHTAHMQLTRAGQGTPPPNFNSVSFCGFKKAAQACWFFTSQG